MNKSKLTAALMAATALCATAPANAQSFGSYAYDTLYTLAFDYPGRYSQTQSFYDATDYMVDRLSFGSGSVTLQDFSWTSRSVTTSSQNVLLNLSGASSDYIVVGAHFDTYPGRATLQGVDDNGSGAAILTELAAHMSGLELNTGLVFAGFGAEEAGLRGSRAYVAALTEEEQANLSGMINIDSLITGDFMYAHAGSNYLDNPELKSFWTRIHAIADEIGMDLRSNPGLNDEYPVDTGCCSDGDAFTGLDIPVLYLESTNWEIGELDGYDQTTNPEIPGGSTWHNATYDNWAFLEAAFGVDRIPERLESYSLLLTRLLVELTDADLISSAAEAGLTAFAMDDLLVRQTEGLRDMGLRAARGRIGGGADVGSFTTAFSVEGMFRPESNSDFGTDGGGSGRFVLDGAWQFSEALSFGAELGYARTSDDLTAGGEVTADTYGVGLNMAYSGGPLWGIASVNYGKTSLEGEREFTLLSGLGAEILRRSFDLDTDANAIGGSLEAGYDFAAGSGLTFSPTIGVDYTRYRIDAFSEDDAGRGAADYAAQRFESTELELGAKIRKQLSLRSMPLALGARASLVRELSNGRPDSILITSQADGSEREATFVEADKSYGYVELSADMALSPASVGWVSVGSRVGHDQGSQAAVALGMSVRF